MKRKEQKHILAAEVIQFSKLLLELVRTGRTTTCVVKTDVGLFMFDPRCIQSAKARKALSITQWIEGKDRYTAYDDVEMSNHIRLIEKEQATYARAHGPAKKGPGLPVIGTAKSSNLIQIDPDEFVEQLRARWNEVKRELDATGRALTIVDEAVQSYKDQKVSAQELLIAVMREFSGLQEFKINWPDYWVAENPPSKPVVRPQYSQRERDRFIAAAYSTCSRTDDFNTFDRQELSRALFELGIEQDRACELVAVEALWNEFEAI